MNRFFPIVGMILLLTAQTVRGEVRGFNVHDGDWRAAEGVLQAPGGPGPKLVLRRPAGQVKAVGVEMFLEDAREGNAGLIVQVSEPGAGADAFIGYEIAVDPSRKMLRLGRHRHDFRLLADVPCDVPVGRWFSFEVALHKESLDVSVDGRLVVRHAIEPGDLPDGAVGLRTWQRPAKFRNFWLESQDARREIAFHDAAEFPPTPAEQLDDRLASLRIEPTRSVLIERLRASEGFSPEAADYFSRLQKLKDQGESLLQQADPAETAVAARLGDLETLQTERLTAVGPIACFLRYPLSRPNAANCYIWQSQPERWGCEIRVLDPLHSEAAQTIFRDEHGSIFDMNLSRDAKTLFFSFRREGEEFWQLYEIGVDGTNLRKISRETGCHDVGANELPDGRLVFISTRRGGYTLCQPGPCSNLYVMNRDGTEARCLSQNTLADFSPHLLSDGRVLFTRWEYVDRDLTYRQSLWTQLPDGRGFRLFFGNTIRDVGTFWQARAVPGHPSLVLATFAPHHNWPHGALGLIDNRAGLENPRGDGFAWITDDVPVIQDQAHRWAYRDPLPLNDFELLAAYGGGGDQGRFEIVLMDYANNRVPIYRHEEMGCYNPLPLRLAEPVAAVAELAHDGDPSEERLQWGEMLLVDARRGMGAEVADRARYIQIMEQVRKKRDLTVRAYDQSPLMSYGTYYAKRCWGRVPLEADGSARFEVPAMREIYLQILDDQGRELARQTSAVQLMPGESQSCIGCHEPREQSPPGSLTSPPLAFSRPAVRPPMPDFTRDGIVDFVGVVQPVLDRYCVRCHQGGDPAGGYDLSGDKTRFFNMAYDNLLGRSRSYRQHNMATGEMLPEETQKGKPLVHFYWLLWTPTAVNRPLWTGTHASRLPDYLTKEHCGEEIPLEMRERVYLWIDANVPYYAEYRFTRPGSAGQRDLCADAATGQLASWYTGDYMDVYRRRCQSCHGEEPLNGSERHWDGRFAWLNLSRPEFSPALTAHLPVAGGGRGVPTEADRPDAMIFGSTDDPDYRKMFDAISRGAEGLRQHPRVDGP